MRHGKKFNHLGRTKPHRKAMLSNMACSLIQHKRINTTLAKAKALRGFVEPLITKSKEDSTHSRRMVFSYLNNKFAVSELFREVAPKIAERPGGYTRIIKTGNRMGDNAEMCMMELVDFNELYTAEPKKEKKTRRRRRGGGSGSKSDSTTDTSKKTEPKADTRTEEKSKVENVKETVKETAAQATEAVKEAAEDTKEAVKDAAKTVADKTEEVAKDVKAKATGSSEDDKKKDDNPAKDDKKEG